MGRSGLEERFERHVAGRFWTHVCWVDPVAPGVSGVVGEYWLRVVLPRKVRYWVKDRAENFGLWMGIGVMKYGSAWWCWMSLGEYAAAHGYAAAELVPARELAGVVAGHPVATVAMVAAWGLLDFKRVVWKRIERARARR